jgi:hypothetical protein
MKYTIRSISDDYDCETCGSSYAEGYEIFKDGELVHVLKPIAHCYGGDSFDGDDLLTWILTDLGHSVDINY